jgi:hypothetical protein
MTLYFENLSFEIIIFLAVIAILFAGTWLLILKNIFKYIFKRELRIKPIFIRLAVILFVSFMIITLIDKPN